MALTTIGDEIELFVPSDFDLCIQGLNIPTRGNAETHVKVFLETVLGDGELAEKIGYSGHEIVHRGSERDLHLRLLFDNQRDITEDRKRLAYFVCCSLFHPDNDGTVLSISKYGILGFSAGKNEFGRIWNLVAVEKTLKRGYDIFQQNFPQPSRERWPMWGNVAAFAVLSSLDDCFNINPSMYGADPEAFAANEQATQARSQQMEPMAKTIGASIVQKLQELSRIRNTTRNVAAVKADLSNSLSAFSGQTQHLFDRIRSLTGSFQSYGAGVDADGQAEETQDTISKADQVELATDLYKLLETCGMVWSSSEILMNTYLRLAGESLKIGVSSGVTAILSGVKAAKSIQVARAAAWHTTAGAIAGRKALAMGACGVIVSAVSTGIAINSTIDAFKKVKRAEICRILQLHVFNVGTIAWQTRTTLTWVAILDREPVFVGEARTAWEAYLRQTYGNALRDELYQPQFVKAELRQCLTDLEACHST